MKVISKTGIGNKNAWIQEARVKILPTNGLLGLVELVVLRKELAPKAGQLWKDIGID